MNSAEPGCTIRRRAALRKLFLAISCPNTVSFIVISGKPITLTASTVNEGFPCCQDRERRYQPEKPCSNSMVKGRFSPSLEDHYCLPNNCFACREQISTIRASTRFFCLFRWQEARKRTSLTIYGHNQRVWKDKSAPSERYRVRLEYTIRNHNMDADSHGN